MIGATIVFIATVALIASYILTVNRMLRTDTNWSESNMARRAPAPRAQSEALPAGRLARA
jgi:hypothetical protein